MTVRCQKQLVHIMTCETFSHPFFRFNSSPNVMVPVNVPSQGHRLWLTFSVLEGFKGLLIRLEFCHSFTLKEQTRVVT